MEEGSLFGAIERLSFTIERLFGLSLELYDWTIGAVWLELYD